MNHLSSQFKEDRALRDAAKSVLMADIEHVQASLSGKGMATRVAGRIGDGAKDAIEAAKLHAGDNRGILAGVIAVLAMWLARGPILEILGLADDEPGDEGYGGDETVKGDPLDGQSPAEADIDPNLAEHRTQINPDEPDEDTKRPRPGEPE